MLVLSYTVARAAAAGAHARGVRRPHHHRNGDLGGIHRGLHGEARARAREVDCIRSNWLTAIAPLTPALRVFRAARLLRDLRYARATRGVRLVRVLTSLNRGTKALARSFSRHGFGYVLTMTLVVTLAGAAGMYAFEKDVAGGLRDYGSALWWTAMIMTTMGSEYWPRSPEGRLLCVVLSLYAFGVFGYVTATIASYLVGRDAAQPQATASAHSADALRGELQALREEMARLGARRAERDRDDEIERVHFRQGAFAGGAEQHDPA